MITEEFVRYAKDNRASDIHLVCGIPPKCRIDGQLVSMPFAPLSEEDCYFIAKEIAGDEFDKIAQIGELDLAQNIAGERVRINLFHQQGTISSAIRILNSRIPRLEDLNLPPIVESFSSWNKGIVLVTGETGSGKSTTLAAILDKINHTRNAHIITLEDPVEYIYTPDKCVINQREIGKDTKSFYDGLRAVLREDPDIILIGEMRDPNTIETAIMAAETGHLVFATLHTNSAPDAIDRIVGTFPAERHSQIRMELSQTLRAVVSQQLLPKMSGVGRAVACEVMIVNPAIRNLIREGKTPQMFSAMLSGANEGSITMDNALIRMEREKIIDPVTAYQSANDREYVKKNVGIF